MYHSGIEEEIIQEITGHRWLAVRSYKRTSDDQKLQVGQIVSGGFKHEWQYLKALLKISNFYFM